MIFIGSFFLRVIPNAPNPVERNSSDSTTLLRRTKSGGSKYSAERSSFEPGTQSESVSYHDDTAKTLTDLNEPESLSLSGEETSSLLSNSSGSSPGDIPYHLAAAKSRMKDDSHDLDIRGLALLSQMKFYQLWLMLGLLTGIGLMTIKLVN